MIKACYIHIPFCHNICSYCDFCKMLYKKDWVLKYLNSLEKEIKKNYKNEILRTLYIGGGTPSCLDKSNLNTLFNITKIFKLDKNYEYTFECNIEDINVSLLELLKKNMVNRLSIGIQTCNFDNLKLLDRKSINVKEKINLCKKYFDNINIDLMYGFNNQTIDDLKKDINSFLELNVNHIATYCLILEDHTKLKINNYQELDDSIQRKMYDLIRKVLKDNNYIHYELSNFCKRGYESKHNLTYWNNEEYYGFGLGASGFINNIRYTNTRNLNKYLDEDYILEYNNLSKKEDMENEMILGLRKIKGVSKKRFLKKYNLSISKVFDTSKLKENKNYYYISSKYLYVSNRILLDFIEI